MLTTKDVTKLFDVTGQTVRNWTKEFSVYLSPSATPQSKGARRTFTIDDLAIFALIVEKTQNGETYEQIKKALENGERAEPPEIIEEAPDITEQFTSREIILVSKITQERDIALGQLKQIKEDRDADREKVDRLNQEIGRLKFELEQIKSEYKN